MRLTTLLPDNVSISFISMRQWLVSKIIRDAATLVSSSPSLMWTFCHVYRQKDLLNDKDLGVYVQQVLENLNSFEHRVINEVANLDNVSFWHRNIERQEFWIA